jgi:hypothetical protein
MGYHIKLYSLNKTDFENFNFLYEKNDDEDYDAYDRLFEEFHKIAKYEFEIGDFLTYDTLPKMKCDLGDTHIISEIALLDIIEQYCRNERKYFSDMLAEKDEKYRIHRMEEYFKNKEFHFKYWKENICWDKTKAKLTNNWRYEYDLLDVLRIYKTFDFEKNILISIGS